MCVCVCVSPQVREPSATVEHEASTSKIGEDQLFYFQQRGVDPEKAVGAIISGFCREVRHNDRHVYALDLSKLANSTKAFGYLDCRCVRT